MFNSPMDYCPHCRQYVALDQAKHECAAQYQCEGMACPLERYFVPATSTTAEAAGEQKAAGSRTTSGLGSENGRAAPEVDQKIEKRR